MTYQTERERQEDESDSVGWNRGSAQPQVVELERPRPGENEVLIEVRATGVNFAELEMTRCR
jgi:NADPH:quinone reductase-like Zn-dependent oxidoreductase